MIPYNGCPLFRQNFSCMTRSALLTQGDRVHNGKVADPATVSRRRRSDNTANKWREQMKLTERNAHCPRHLEDGIRDVGAVFPQAPKSVAKLGERDRQTDRSEGAAGVWQRG